MVYRSSKQHRVGQAAYRSYNIDQAALDVIERQLEREARANHYLSELERIHAEHQQRRTQDGR